MARSWATRYVPMPSENRDRTTIHTPNVCNRAFVTSSFRRKLISGSLLSWHIYIHTHMRVCVSVESLGVPIQVLVQFLHCSKRPCIFEPWRQQIDVSLHVELLRLFDIVALEHRIDDQVDLGDAISKVLVHEASECQLCLLELLSYDRCLMSPAEPSSLLKLVSHIPAYDMSATCGGSSLTNLECTNRSTLEMTWRQSGAINARSSNS